MYVDGLIPFIVVSDSKLWLNAKAYTVAITQILFWVILSEPILIILL